MVKIVLVTTDVRIKVSLKAWKTNFTVKTTSPAIRILIFRHITKSYPYHAPYSAPSQLPSQPPCRPTKIQVANQNPSDTCQRVVIKWKESGSSVAPEGPKGVFVKPFFTLSYVCNKVEKFSYFSYTFSSKSSLIWVSTIKILFNLRKIYQI